jgi:cellulase
MGELPTPNTSVNAVKFFKVEDKGYDPKTGKLSLFSSMTAVNFQSIDTWANEKAADNGMSHSFQIPSDIKPGTYVLRTELLALHANTAAMKMTPVSGPEFYLHCFNIEVTGNGTVTPEGNTFPGTYKPTDPGLSFVPYYGDGSGVEHNSKYVSTWYWRTLHPFSHN